MAVKPLVRDALRIALRTPLHLAVRLPKFERVDLVYERQATFQDLGRPAKAKNVPWVLESNGPFWYEADVERGTLGFPLLAKKLELAAYRDADLVVAVSAPLKEIICSAAGIGEDRVLVLPNAVDLRRFSPPISEDNQRQGPAVRVGFVGYLADWAGVDLLLRAAAKLNGAGADLELLIVGDGPAKPQLRALASSLNIDRFTQFLGHVPYEEVPNVMRTLDIAYSGQRTMRIGSMYHSPMKLYEYQAMGLPVVASAHADALALVGSVGSGWLFEDGSLAALTAALGSALEAEDRVQRGAAGRRVVEREHSWDNRIATLSERLTLRGLA